MRDLIIALVASVAFACCNILSAEESAAERPNVIFFYIDDSGWGDYSCYGNTNVKTKNVDSIAAQGIQFNNFYVGAPVCSPSRCSAMSGMFSGNLGVHHIFSTARAKKLKAQLRMNSVTHLPENIPLITKAFKDGGYFVGHFGKWHLADSDNQNLPNPDKYGIDRYRTVNATDKRYTFPKGVPQNSVSTQYIVNDAINFLKEAKELNKPFYLNVWTILPHAAITPTKAQLARVHPKNKVRVKMPEGVHVSSITEVYYSAILEVDFQLGRLVSALKEQGLYDNTIIIISSDNGPEPFQSGECNYSGAGCTGLFRGNKRSLYEGGIRVPGIISWPAKIKNPRIDNSTVLSVMDIFPSLSRICGLECPYDKLDGEDMSEVFYGAKKERTKPIFWSFFSDAIAGHPAVISPNMAMRYGKWSFLMNHDGSRKELYDLKKDPKQVDNVANENPELTKKFSEMLLKYYENLPNRDKLVKTSGVDNSTFNKLLQAE